MDTSVGVNVGAGCCCWGVGNGEDRASGEVDANGVSGVDTVTLPQPPNQGRDIKIKI